MFAYFSYHNNVYSHVKYILVREFYLFSLRLPWFKSVVPFDSYEVLAIFQRQFANCVQRCWRQTSFERSTSAHRTHDASSSDARRDATKKCTRCDRKRIQSCTGLLFSLLPRDCICNIHIHYFSSKISRKRRNVLQGRQIWKQTFRRHLRALVQLMSRKLLNLHRLWHNAAFKMWY